MEAAIAAESEEGKLRVEAAYGRMAEAETRREEKAARDAQPRDPPPPARDPGKSPSSLRHQRVLGIGSWVMEGNGQHGSSRD